LASGQIPRATLEVAKALAEKVLAEFGQQEGELTFAKRAPKARQDLWRKLNIMPRGIDREIVEVMHRTTMGVDNDYRNSAAWDARGARRGWAAP
jgi:carbon-monoxide dehydrogenase catalytic subunit